MERVFELTRRYPGVQPGDRTFTLAGGETVRRRGTALGIDTGGVYKAATPGNFIGFLARDVTTSGPTMGQLYNLDGPTSGDDPNYEPLPWKSGDNVAVFTADEFEAEGSDHLVTSGTGAVTSSSTVGTLLEPYDGKWREDQSSGANAVFMVTKVKTDAADIVDSSNTVRIVAERLKR